MDGDPRGLGWEAYEAARREEGPRPTRDRTGAAGADSERRDRRESCRGNENHNGHSAHIAAGEPTQEECEKVVVGIREGRTSGSAAGMRCHHVWPARLRSPRWRRFMWWSSTSVGSR